MINELPFPVAVFPVAMFNEKYASLHLSYLLLRTPGRDVEGLGVNPSSPRALQGTVLLLLAPLQSSMGCDREMRRDP